MRNTITALTAFLLLALTASVIQAGIKVEICHVPPNDPTGFHTIRISENAFAAHLAHGDLGAPCDEFCATLCDDGDACTIDDTGDCEQVGCPTAAEQVDCDDQNECTADSCDSVDGCVNAPRIGEACDDGEICSGPDQCTPEGTCQGATIPDCCVDDGACSQNPCDQASCNLTTNRCVDDPVVCDAPDACTISECAPDTGQCVESAVVCDEGELCDVCGGGCRAMTSCPCWSLEELQAITPAPTDVEFWSELANWIPEDFCNDSIDFDNLFVPTGPFPFEGFTCATLNTLTQDYLDEFFDPDSPPFIPCQTFVPVGPGAIVWPFSPWFPDDQQPSCAYAAGDGCVRIHDITVEELATCVGQVQAQGMAEGWSCFPAGPCADVVCDEGEACNPDTGMCEPACPCWTLEELDNVLMLPVDDQWPRTLGHIPPNAPTDESHEIVLDGYPGWVPESACNNNLDPLNTFYSGLPATCAAINIAPQPVLDQFCDDYFCSNPLEICDWPIASIQTEQLPEGSSAVLALDDNDGDGLGRCFYAGPDHTTFRGDLTLEQLAVCEAQIQSHGAAGGWSCFAP